MDNKLIEALNHPNKISFTSDEMMVSLREYLTKEYGEYVEPFLQWYDRPDIKAVVTPRELTNLIRTYQKLETAKKQDGPSLDSFLEKFNDFNAIVKVLMPKIAQDVEATKDLMNRIEDKSVEDKIKSMREKSLSKDVGNENKLKS